MSYLLAICLSYHMQTNCYHQRLEKGNNSRNNTMCFGKQSEGFAIRKKHIIFFLRSSKLPDSPWHYFFFIVTLIIVVPSIPVMTQKSIILIALQPHNKNYVLTWRLKSTSRILRTGACSREEKGMLWGTNIAFLGNALLYTSKITVVFFVLFLKSMGKRKILCNL